MPIRKVADSVLDGAKYALRGLPLVFRPGFRRFVMVPVLLNAVLFGAGFWVSGYYYSEFLAWLVPSWLDWLRWLLWPVFGLAFLVFTLFSFSLSANLFGCFFYGGLSRKVESEILRIEPDSKAPPSPTGGLGGFFSELKRLGYFLSRATPLLLLFLIPGINLIAPFLWLFFSAWFLGMEYMAYPLEEAGLDFAQQRRQLRPKRLNVAVFGGLVLMGLALPVFNLIVPPAAVIGATLYIHALKSRSREVATA